MKRVFLAILLTIGLKGYGQIFSCNSTEYAGIAPISINGSISDWELILGASTGDAIFPFGTSPIIYDTYGANDPDHPESNIDLRAKTVAYDDNNVYFYFRRLDNSNSSVKAFYFLDTNVDGLMSSGEPVIIINFNSQKVHKLSLGYYVPANPTGDPIGQAFPGNICFVDGFSMKGTVDDVINSKKVELFANEIFDGVVTEDGYGVEFAIPWRLISTYKIFSYHLALQKGGGSYDPLEASDNTGGCGTNLTVIGNPDIAVSNTTVTTITEGLSFRIDLDITNLTSAALSIDASTFISFKDIVQNGDLPIDETQFTVIVNGVQYPYYDGTFADQPIRYSNLLLPGAGIFEIDPLATETISIIISFPPNFSVQSAVVDIQPSANFEILRRCFGHLGGGGKPTNPIGVPVGDATSTKSRSSQHHENEITTETLKKMILYPNPSRGRATLLLPDSKRAYEIQLTDYTGRVIRKWQNVSAGRFDIETKQPGFYLLNIISGSGVRYVKKLIVQ